MKVKVAAYRKHTDITPKIIITVDESREVSIASAWLSKTDTSMVVAFRDINEIRNKTNRIYTRSWMRENLWNKESATVH